MADGTNRSGILTPWLERAPSALFVLYASFAAFSTYFCMYAFRRPFTVATFEGESFLGTDLQLKTAIVISQVLGYMCSKYIGIKVCSEITSKRRATLLLGLILWAQAALVLYGLAPHEWKVLAIFFNGLPLGMVWGLVVGYLEGRRTSEILLAALSASFIVASSMTKDVGDWVMLAWGVSESWMPAVTGMLFLGPFFFCTWLLNQIPQPSAVDIAARTRRQPMRHVHRLAFFRHFFWGMLLLLIVYFFLTAYRDFRDFYGREIFNALGYPPHEVAGIFTRAEIWVMLGVVVAMGTLNLIRDNRRGLLAAFAMMTGGVAMLGVGTLLYDAHRISGLTWMILVGLGAYLAYVPFGTVLFERLIASTRVVGTAVFAIYLADAIGYTGSVGVQLYYDFGHSDLTHLEFFRAFSYFMSLLGVALLTSSGAYFLLRHAPMDRPMRTMTPARAGA